MDDRRRILDELHQTDRPIVIYGAGIVGETLLELLHQAGLHVALFCDSSKDVAARRFCGKDVVYAPELRIDDALVIVSTASIHDAVAQLEDLGLTRWYCGGDLLREVDTSQDSADGAIDYRRYAIETCIFCHDAYKQRNERLMVRSVDLIITERCSLKCRGCANLMQYYQTPRHVPLETLFETIATFCEVVDDLLEFRVIGGEPFTNPEWPQVVARLVAEPKVRRVVLYTNGTIVPSPGARKALEHDKVVVIVSNYGPLSRNLNTLIRLCKERRVKHHVYNVTEWLECYKIGRRNRSVEENKRIFKRCCGKNMATLSHGKLFRCPYAANAHRLRAVPDFRSDCVDLLGSLGRGVDARRLKEEVRRYLMELEWLKTCDYCSGRPLSGREIDPPVRTILPAVQTRKPLPYSRYPQAPQKGLEALAAGDEAAWRGNA